MSGGSYNYLYLHTGGLEAQRGDIEDMRDRLQGLAEEGVAGAALAAEQTRAILAHFDLAEEKAQTLSDVWHAVEWRDSCDYGDDQVREALAKYPGDAAKEEAGV